MSLLHNDRVQFENTHWAMLHLVMRLVHNKSVQCNESAIVYNLKTHSGEKPNNVTSGNEPSAQQ